MIASCDAVENYMFLRDSQLVVIRKVDMNCISLLVRCKIEPDTYNIRG